MKLWPFGKRAQKQVRTEPLVNRRAIAALNKQHPRGQQRMFDAAKADRLAMEWGTQPLTADEIVEKNWRPVTARAQEQIANNDYGRNYVRMCVNNIIGQGIMLRGMSKGNDGALDVQANRAIERAWKEWSNRKNCDITGRLSLREMQKLAIRSCAASGEYCYRFVTGDDAGPWGFGLQAIPVTRIPVEMSVDRLHGGTNFVRFGIEFTKYGRPVAYYFTTIQTDENKFMYNGNPYVRVPAEEIIHDFTNDLTGQKRGLSWLATSLVRMRQLNGMEEAALVNARVGASKMAFIKFDDTTSGPEYDEDDPPIMEVEAGEIGILPQGASIDKVDFQYPAGEYATFTKDQKRGMAAGVGVSYHNLSGDLEGVNFSSIRQGTLDERESWKDLQDWFTEGFMARVFEEWLPRALLAGRIVTENGRPLSVLKLEKYRQVEWQARRWDWIDPEKDVNAAIKARNAGLRSTTEIIQDDGKDPQAVWEQAAADFDSQVDHYVKKGVDRKRAEIIVMSGMQIDSKLLLEQEKPNEKDSSGSSSNSANS